MRSLFWAAMFVAFSASAQTNLQFVTTGASVERAIHLEWQSRSNAVYRIEYLADLQSSNNVWKTLYEQYPSHGTNTFLLDTGEYFKDPVVHHPSKMPHRFYRVVETGTNTAPKPFVSITSPTNNAVLSGEIVVSLVATSSLPLLETRLYVDGEEVDSEDGTNYVINTCEWPNGSHTLFAVAKAVSDYGGVNRTTTVISNAFAVSAYVPVTFNNFISRTLASHRKSGWSLF